jgi:hypothetical protein
VAGQLGRRLDESGRGLPQGRRLDLAAARQLDQASGAYKLKPDAPEADDAVRTLSSFYVPVFEKMLADGTIVEYEIDREMFHTTDSRAQIVFVFLMPSVEGLDKFRAALGAALSQNSLIGPAFGSMMVSYTPEPDYVRVNATYK